MIIKIDDACGNGEEKEQIWVQEEAQIRYCWLL